MPIEQKHKTINEAIQYHYNKYGSEKAKQIVYNNPRTIYNTGLLVTSNDTFDSLVKHQKCSDFAYIWNEFQQRSSHYGNAQTHTHAHSHKNE